MLSLLLFACLELLLVSRSISLLKWDLLELDISAANVAGFFNDTMLPAIEIREEKKA